MTCAQFLETAPRSAAAGQRIMHVITALSVGGAEKMLKKIATGLDPAAIDIVSLIQPGVTGESLERLGFKITSLGMARGAPSLRAFGALRRLIAERRPSAIVGWMHHAYLATTLARVGVRNAPPVVWNVRHSIANISHESVQTRAILRFCAGLSKTPAAIIYNSHIARQQYAALGFDDARAVVIPNGFDTGNFRPDAEARGRLAGIFGIEGSDPVIAMVARFHPMKSQETLLAAFRIALERGARARLLLVGDGADALPPSIAEIIATLPAKTVFLSGHRTDLETWLPGVDIFALSSRWGEAFPNVLGEAMASGVPCVATNVGDSALIIGETGAVAPPGDAAALSEALLKLLRMPSGARKEMGKAARRRIVENYALAAVRARYAGLINAVCEGREAAGGPG